MSNFLIVTITKWKQTSNNQIEYYFNLHSELTNKNWEIVHTLEEYDKYHQYLLITFSNLPLFPDLHFAYLNLQKTKILLEMYTDEILQRNDILSNPQTEVFFDLKKNHFCDFYQYQPTVILTELKSTKIIRAKELDIFISAYKNELSLLDIDLENEKSFVEKILELQTFGEGKEYFNQCVWKIVENNLKTKQQMLNEQYKAATSYDERKEIAEKLNEIIKKLSERKL